MSDMLKNRIQVENQPKNNIACVSLFNETPCRDDLSVTIFHSLEAGIAKAICSFK